MFKSIFLFIFSLAFLIIMIFLIANLGLGETLSKVVILFSVAVTFGLVLTALR